MERYAQRCVLTGRHRQNHVWVVFLSEETLLDEILHLCDRGASLEIRNQKEGTPNQFLFVAPTIECPRKCNGFVADH